MIDGLPVVNLGATGLLALVVLLVLTDRLVWYKRLRVIEAQLATERELNVELTKQNSMLLGSAIPTVNAVLTALHQAAEGDDHR
jgi:hypothetical protein